MKSRTRCHGTTSVNLREQETAKFGILFHCVTCVDIFVVIMDKLKSKGLRFDEKEKIKIIDEFCETRSNNLINKADLLVEGKHEYDNKFLFQLLSSF